MNMDFPYTELFVYRVIFPVIALFVLRISYKCFKTANKIKNDKNWYDYPGKKYESIPKIVCIVPMLFFGLSFLIGTVGLLEASYFYEARVELPKMQVPKVKIIR